ncbi:MAG: hypothetical protein RLO06_15205 [Parvibaculum sp.]
MKTPWWLQGIPQINQMYLTAVKAAADEDSQQAALFFGLTPQVVERLRKMTLAELLVIAGQETSLLTISRQFWAIVDSGDEPQLLRSARLRAFLTATAEAENGRG